jgi:hypothetical protein
MVDFPSNPVAGNTYSINSQTWLYDGAGWVRTTLNTVIPSQTGNAGRYLTTNGSVVTWADSSSVTVVSDTQPALTAAGTLWYDPEYGVLSVYASGVWTDVGGAAASTVLVADNPPVSAITGNLWFNTTDLNTYVYYNDGNSNQWIAIGIEDPATAASILPGQTGNAGRYLTTDGTSTSWSTVQALPSQTGNSGRYLTTDGTTASWNTVQALPSQTGNSGKYLTTDGTTASWAALSAIVFDGGAPDTIYTTGPVFDAGGVT